MNEVTKKWYNEKEQKNEEPILTEMCDVCCKDCKYPIPRTIYLTKSGTKYIIRHHTWCNPIEFAKTFFFFFTSCKIFRIVHKVK